MAAMKRLTMITSTTIPNAETSPAHAMWIGVRLYVTGALMLIAAGWLAVFSMRVAVGATTLEDGWAISLWGMMAGAVYVVGLWPLRLLPITGGQLIWILGVGLAMRVLLLTTAPILEDDFYRYLWDGAVTAHGVNPFSHAPADVLRQATGETRAELPPALLGEEARNVLAKINHPHLTTVYGPVAQVIFAASHAIAPWSILGWRVVLMFFDGLTMAALLALLRTLGAPVVGSAWYWWNPIVLREVISSGHMDVIALPFVIVALMLAIRRYSVAAGVLVALASAVKVWPVVLLPLVIRASARNARTAILALTTFALTPILMWGPVLSAARAETSGYRAYALTWDNNDAIFRAAHWATNQLLSLGNIDSVNAARASRYIVASMLALFVLIQTLRATVDARDIVRRALLVVAVTFLLSPAQFPWYFLWMLPLLAAAPRISLLLYTILLPLYYVHYEYSWVVWVEHLPVLAWFVAEAWWLKRRGRWNLNTIGVASCTTIEPSP